MRNNKSVIGIITLLIFIAVVVTSINACGYLGIFGEVSWKEEVLLHDGSKIIVKRWQKRKGSYAPDQTPPIGEQSIKFTLPGTKKVITWKDEYSKEIGRSNFELLALHILNSTPYIITTPRLCLSYNKWGRPNPPYVIFKYDGKEWKRIDLAELPVEFKNINLVIETKGEEKNIVSLGLVSAETIKKINSDSTQEEYKTIVRTPIKIWCEEMIYDGTYWHGISGLRKQPSYEACLELCPKIGISAKNCPCKEIFKNK
jgi:flagellin-like protein